MSTPSENRRPALRAVPDPHPEDSTDDGVLLDVDGDGVPDRVYHPQETSTDLALRTGSEIATRAPETSVAARVLTREHALLPVVPEWLKTPQGRRANARWFLRRHWHAVRFHGLRVPAYTARVLTRAPLGVWRSLVWLSRWVVDWRADPMEQELAAGTRGDAKEYRLVREDRTRRVRARASLVLGLVVLLAVGVVVFLHVTPAWAHAVAATAVVLLFARIGTGRGRSLLGAAMVASSGFRELTDAIVMRALRVAGLGGAPAKLDKDGREVAEDTRPTLAAPIARAETGAGYLVTVDLPYGKTVADAATARAQIASGLDVDEVQVFVEAVPGSSRRVALYVADSDPFLLPARPSPLARLPRVSVWDSHPLGVEPRGREASPSLMFNSFLIGAIPRSGKTFAARTLVSPALLDPFCDVTILDFKGGKDWKMGGDLAVTYRSGDTDEDLLYGLTVLSNLKAEAQKRFEDFRGMSDEENPEGKLTRELSQAGYRPHCIIIDEVQNLLRAPDKKVQQEALALLIWLAKTAPAAGYFLTMATQRPATDVIPSDLRDNTSVRLALRTKTWQSSDAILGAGINAIGFGTQRFLEEHRGAAILGGVSNGRGGDLATIRVDLVTLADFTRMCRVGRQRRIDAGTLRGAAAGVADDVIVTVTVVEDVLSIWPGEESKAQAAMLLPRLREVYPERYAAWDPEDTTALTKALKDHGVSTVQVNRDGANRNGYSHATLRRAAAKAIER